MEVSGRLHVPCEWALGEEFPADSKQKGGVTSLAKCKIIYRVSLKDSSGFKQLYIR
jgi:hypothetical protein